MGYACIIAPCSTRALGLLSCWVFPVSAEGSTPLYGTIPPDKNALHGFSEQDSTEILLLRIYVFSFERAPFGYPRVHIPSKVASELSLTIHLGLASLPNPQLR